MSSENKSTPQEKINWAILAPGKIAKKFATALNGVKDAHLYSVASRNSERAEAFAEEFGFETFAHDYHALSRDPKVDVIYIASPHTFHVEQSIACLEAGKAVLCEKPMSINARDAQRVFDAANANNAFYMEAVWTRFMPSLDKVRDLIVGGAIGEIQTAQASFGIDVPFDETHRLYDKSLAGGALLDVGIYTVTFAQWLMQTMPEKITANAVIGKTGVDQRTSISLRYPKGQLITLNSAVDSRSNHEAWIFGSKGRIRMASFWQCQEIMLETEQGQTLIPVPHRINGYEGEIEETNRCLREGKIQSAIHPWSESLNVMQIMDAAREQIGLRYSEDG